MHYAWNVLISTGLVTVFTAKVTIEYQLPILTQVRKCLIQKGPPLYLANLKPLLLHLQRLKTTNECILSSLNGMSMATEKVGQTDSTELEQNTFTYLVE